MFVAAFDAEEIAFLVELLSRFDCGLERTRGGVVSITGEMWASEPVFNSEHEGMKLRGEDADLLVRVLHRMGYKTSTMREGDDPIIIKIPLPT